jgi:hypothetical protein
VLFKKKEAAYYPVKNSALRKLRKISDHQILQWVDNIHSGLGINIQELRKSLGTNDQALIYAEDIRTGVVSLLAAMEIIEERRTTTILRSLDTQNISPDQLRSVVVPRPTRSI